MYALVENGTVTRVGLPRNWRHISNTHALPPEKLASLGWLPVTEQKPEYDPETEYLVLDHYEVGDGTVVAVYRTEQKPPVVDWAAGFAKCDSVAALRDTLIEYLGLAPAAQHEAKG